MSIEDPEEPESVGQAASTYFANVSEKDGVEFVSSGAAIFDCMLGGGWAEGRVVNLVGDRSAGKTLLAMEAMANYHIKHPKALMRYAESEHAFDPSYAEALGCPVSAVEFVPENEPLRTIEDWHADIKDFITRVKRKGDKRGMYILDSLDALSDDAEAKRGIDEGSFGASKAKKMGEVFRRIVADMDEANITLIVVSQLRDKIGVMFGEKQTRSGGRALDFYASHIVWLAEIGKIKKKMGGIERVIGVNVRARVKKNKVGLPFRECEYPVIFGYGVDDLTANVEWLISADREKELREEVGMSKAGYSVRIANLRDKGGEPIREVRGKLAALVKREWQTIEQGFLPKAGKY